MSLILNLVCVVVLVVLYRHLVQSADEEDAAFREEQNAAASKPVLRGPDDWGPPPVCKVHGVHTRWVFADDWRMASLLFCNTEPFLAGILLQPRSRRVWHEPRQAGASFFDAYGWTLDNAVDLCRLTWRARTLLIKAYPCSINHGRLTLHWAQPSLGDTDAVGFRERCELVDHFLGDAREVSPVPANLWLMMALDPSEDFRCFAFEALMDEFFEDVPWDKDESLWDWWRYGDGVGTQAPESLAGKLRQWTPARCTARFALLFDGIDAAATSGENQPRFDGLMRVLLSHFAPLIARHRPPGAAPAEVTDVSAQGRLFLAVVFPEWLNAEDLQRLVDRFTASPEDDLLPLLLRLPEALQNSLLVGLVRAGWAEARTQALFVGGTRLDAVAAFFYETGEVGEQVCVCQLFERIQEPRLYSLLMYLTHRLEAGACPPEQRYAVVTELLRLVAAVAGEEDMQLLQRLSPFCSSPKTMAALKKAQYAVAKRHGVSLDGLLSVIAADEAGSLSPAQREDGFLSQADDEAS